MIRVFTGNSSRLLTRQVLNPLIGLEMVLHPKIFALLVVPFEGMATISIHVTEGKRGPSIGKKDGDLMDGLRGQ